MYSVSKYIFLVFVSVSGLSGSAVEAQSQVSVGMGLLAGSTVMLLTVIWGTCVLVGKCDIQNSVAVDLRDTRGYSFTGDLLRLCSWMQYLFTLLSEIFVVNNVIDFERNRG